MHSKDNLSKIMPAAKTVGEDALTSAVRPILSEAANANIIGYVPGNAFSSNNVTQGKPHDIGANFNQPLSFSPDITAGFSGKKGKAKTLDAWGGNFDLSSALSYYIPFRAFGYGWQAGYGFIKNKIFSITQSQYSLLRDFGEWFSNSPEKKLKQAEAIMFTSLAGVYAVTSTKELLRDCGLALGAEFGKNPNATSLVDLRTSKNSIIQSAVDRHIWQHGARLAAGVGFLHHLMTGILSNILVISMERSIFFRPIAYNLLQVAVNNVQFNELGDRGAKENLVNDLVKVMQACRFDHRRSTIHRQQVDELRPVLEKVAEDILDKRFGFKGALYIMGGGLLIPGNPAQSMANYEHVRAVGVEGVAVENFYKHGGKAANNNYPVSNDNRPPDNLITNAKLEQRRKKGYVAESAERQELIRQRQAIFSKGPAYAGSSDDARPAVGMVI